MLSDEAIRRKTVFMALEVGAVVEGKVVSIMPFGAFVSLPDGKMGLVHISEVALDYVQDVSEHLSENQEVKVKVVGIDQKGKISLSIKKVLLEEKKASGGRSQRTAQASVRPASVDLITPQNSSSDMSFEDMLGKFKTDSDEKMQALKRSSESKRSGGYKRSSGNNYF